MSDERRDPKEPQEPAKPFVSKSILKHVGEVVLRYEEAAAKAPEGKQIHRRRPLPSVPEAPPEQADEKPEAESSQ